jgi:methionine-rich copper-binding protein CopC
MKKFPIAGMAALLVTVVLGLGLAAPAQAHTTLKSSTPEKNAKVESLRKVTLEFSESVRFPTLLVRGEDGKRYENGQPVVNGLKVSVDVDASIPTGGYTIAWRVVSEDGHPLTGEIPFTVVDEPSPASTTGTATPTTTPTAAAPATATPPVTPTAVTAATTPAADTQQDEPRIPGWLWVVVFGVGGIGIGMVISMRKKP